jgi:D-glycero-D-manno-heptose 1,7-bisphosphate phosphatase
MIIDDASMKPNFHDPRPLSPTNIRHVFLDRDGVINQKPPEGTYISEWSRMQVLPGVETAIAKLNLSNRRIIVVTNQRGIALGLYSGADLETLHMRLQEHLEEHGAHIDAFYYCPHDADQCDCRKPKPGLFLQAQRDFPHILPSNSLLIGDSVSDIEWARNLGIPAILILGPPETRKPGSARAIALADAVSSSLEEAIDEYLVY